MQALCMCKHASMLGGVGWGRVGWGECVGEWAGGWAGRAGQGSGRQAELTGRKELTRK